MRFKKRKNYTIFVYIFLLILSMYSSYLLFLSDEEKKDLLLYKLLLMSTNQGEILLADVKEKMYSPKYIIYNSLNKLVSKNNLSVFSNIDDDIFNYDEAKSEYVIDTNNQKVNNPVVYLYNSHQLEEYSNKVSLDYNVKPNVMIASFILRENLNDLNINTIVETKNVKEFLNNNKLPYSKSYLATETFAKEAKKSNNSLIYFIDIHRDSANYDTTYYEKDNKSYARIMFVTGFEHTLKENNIGFAESINSMIEEEYPGLSRGILYKSVIRNDVYNPDIDGKGLLIEVGGVDNTLEEVNNTLSVVSKVLKEYIKANI